MKIIILIILFGTAFALQSCRTDDNSELIKKINALNAYKVETYFPLGKESKKLFSAKRTFFTVNGNKVDTTNRFYYTLERESGKYNDLSGIEWFKIQRDTAFDTTMFVPSYLNLFRQFGDGIFQKNLNESLIILKQPIQKDKVWDSNEYNSLGAEFMKIFQTDTTIEIYSGTNPKKYPNCIIVLQRSVTDSYLSEVEVYEIYAPNIGKIKRYEKVLKYESANPPKLSDQSYIYEENFIQFIK